ncbi:hypothetical protein BpHYR1_039616 [Brachionus plicatilis]|uniref:Uncharacterized protein n=1 Tax=Brachionus plicatilis TaxID=10195 RepID=A0A3M7P6F4_BRAPC|nr:hypothetical protein BpHYR1_039616 [Brachionus plicatilis]
MIYKIQVLSLDETRYHLKWIYFLDNLYARIMIFTKSSSIYERGIAEDFLSAPKNLKLRQACLRRRLSRKTSMVARCIEISLNLSTGIFPCIESILELVYSRGIDYFLR